MLPASLQSAIAAVENATSGYEKCTLNIAMAYGGREEITDGFKNFLLDQKKTGTHLKKLLPMLIPA